MASPVPRIYCFGEVLWDVVPRGLYLGGAPLNVAYHLSRLGARAIPVSAVGDDFLGHEALRRMDAWKMDRGLVATARRRPTGTAGAAVDRRGSPVFKITEQVAWDEIPLPRRTVLTAAPDAVVFGTLALRARPNRKVLRELLSRFPQALRVVDLNLRSPFIADEVVKEALDAVQLLKLNLDELNHLTGRATTVRQIESAARQVAGSHAVQHICITAGKRGAGVLHRGQWRWETARPVAVRDTIGAGDAFLAGYLMALLARREDPRWALARACRHGEFIATCDGATPPYRCASNGTFQRSPDY